MSSIWLQAPRPRTVARARVTSIADARAIERTPYWELLPSWSILGMIEHAAAERPNESAIVVLDRDDPTHTDWRITYAELGAMVRGIANRLCDVSGDTPPVVSILTPLLSYGLECRQAKLNS